MVSSFIFQDTSTATPEIHREIWRTRPTLQNLTSGGVISSEELCSSAVTHFDLHFGLIPTWTSMLSVDDVFASCGPSIWSHFNNAWAAPYTAARQWFSSMVMGAAPAFGSALLSEFEYQARAKELFVYLEDLARSGLVADHIMQDAWRGWSRLNEVFSGALAVPDAAPGPNGEILYTWDKDEHHAELEYFSEGVPLSFYMNRATGHSVEKEFLTGHVPKEIRDMLRFFVER